MDVCAAESYSTRKKKSQGVVKVTLIYTPFKQVHFVFPCKFKCFIDSHVGRRIGLFFTYIVLSIYMPKAHLNKVSPSYPKLLDKNNRPRGL